MWLDNSEKSSTTCGLILLLKIKLAIIGKIDVLLINILPFGGLGIWRPARSKKRKKMSGVGGVGAAGGASGAGGVSSSGGGAASVAPTPSDGSASIGTDAPGKVGNSGGDTENVEKFGAGQNVNMTQNTNITNVNMSTQDHMHCREMGQAGGVGQAQESPEIDLKKLIEMMIMLKMLQAMQQQG